MTSYSTRIRGPIARAEYQVHLELPGGGRLYLVEAANLDKLADLLEREVRVAHPNQHVGVRLDLDGTVLIRVGWTAMVAAGTWQAVTG